RRASPGVGARFARYGNRNRPWRNWGAWLDAVSSEFALRSATHRSGYFCSRAPVNGQCLVRGIVPPGAASNAGRSDGGAEVRMIAPTIAGMRDSKLEGI